VRNLSNGCSWLSWWPSYNQMCDSRGCQKRLLIEFYNPWCSLDHVTQRHTIWSGIVDDICDNCKWVNVHKYRPRKLSLYLLSHRLQCRIESHYHVLDASDATPIQTSSCHFWGSASYGSNIGHCKFSHSQAVCCLQVINVAQKFLSRFQSTDLNCTLMAPWLSLHGK